MTTDEYIEHEVKLRVHELKFQLLEGKLNFLIRLAISGIGLGISDVILPTLLHWAKLT